MPNDLVRAVEGMALARLPPSAATIHRRLVDLAAERGWPVPAPRTVRAIVGEIDPATQDLGALDEAIARIEGSLPVGAERREDQT